MTNATKLKIYPSFLEFRLVYRTSGIDIYFFPLHSVRASLSQYIYLVVMQEIGTNLKKKKVFKGKLDVATGAFQAV